MILGKGVGDISTPRGISKWFDGMQSLRDFSVWHGMVAIFRHCGIQDIGLGSSALADVPVQGLKTWM